jgi:hypothetical protein
MDLSSHSPCKPIGFVGIISPAFQFVNKKTKKNKKKFYLPIDRVGF